MESTDDEPKRASPSLFDSMIGSAGKQASLSRILRRGDGQKRLGSQDMSPQSQIANMEVGEADGGNSTGYRTYKRRWFGLLQLVLMNIIVSWDWLTFAPVAKHAASYYSVSESTINWISTAFFLAFVFIFPITIVVLHRSLKLSFVIAAVLILIGNWIRYAGATSKDGGSIAYAMAGEIIIGFAQPFILAAPTRYSDMWFTSRGRVAATAAMSLANPLGAALGQLIIPFWVSKPSDVSNMVLYVSILSTVGSVPALFVPAKPPTPVGPSSKTPKLPLRESFAAVTKSVELWLLLVPFSIFVGLFNSTSSLLNQIMGPYGFTNDESGIGGAVLIAVGLVTAAISSPILDRNKKFLPAIRVLVPIIALGYLAFVWMPGTRGIEGPYIVLAILGASSFAVVPVVLECLIELSHPLSPEVTSTVAWAGGQLFGAIFIIVSDALVADKDATPPRNMKNALIFQAVIAMTTAVIPLCLGLFGRQDQVSLRRIASDDSSRRTDVTLQE